MRIRAPRPIHKKTQYKWVFVDEEARTFSPYLGNTQRYPLPKGKRPGQWTDRRRYPVLCTRGWHTAPLATVGLFLYPGIWRAGEYRLYQVECKGEFDADEKKVCWEQIRLVKEVTAGKIVSRAIEAAGHINSVTWNTKSKRFSNRKGA